MRRLTTRSGAVALTAVLLLGASACGDDDDSDDEATPTAEDVADDPVAYCDALLEFNAVVLDVDTEGASEDEIKEIGGVLAPPFQQMADTAPEEVAEAVDDLNDEAIQPLLDGDADVFDNDQSFEDYTALVADSTDVCDFEEISITAVDYAFAGVPETLSAGPYSIVLANESEEEEHEAIIFRKADGVELSIEEIVNLPEEETEDKVVFTAAAFAPPGGTGASLAELEPGAYAMVCFIPVGGGEEGSPHFTEGMLTEFTVT